MKTFTLDELENLQLKDIDIEACFEPLAQAAFLAFCYQYPEARSLLKDICRSVFINGARTVINATRKELSTE